jgi:acetyl-CoA synthetase
MTTKQLESSLQESRLFPPPADFAAAAHPDAAGLAALHAAAAHDHVGFWADQARSALHWHTPFTQTLDDSAAPNYRWFADGTLNVSVNCLDVHLAEHGNKAAIIAESEVGITRTLSYRQVHAEVCRAANALRRLGVRSGDRVVIYLPMVPEAVIAMQACARIGAVHSVVFGGFSALSLRERIEDAGARLLITADGGQRGGNIVELKAAADKALAEGAASIEQVIVLRQTGHDISMTAGRDQWWHEVLAAESPVCEPEWVEAEHPLFLLYTSGSTGKPKGIQHSSAGYLLGTKLSTQWVFDLKLHDVFWCTADVGWITGHSYVAYGPLANAGTLVIYEGGPVYPDAGRFWRLIEQHRVTIFYTSPTALRALMKLGDDIPASTTSRRCAYWGVWVSRSILKRGCGTTQSLVADGAPSSIRGGRPRRGPSCWRRCLVSQPPSPVPARCPCPVSLPISSMRTATALLRPTPEVHWWCVSLGLPCCALSGTTTRATSTPIGHAFRIASMLLAMAPTAMPMVTSGSWVALTMC